MNKKFLLLAAISIAIFIFCLYLFSKTSILNPNFLLKKKILTQYPQIQKPGISDFEKVNLLRQWTFENAAWASNKYQVKKYIKNKEAPMIFSLLSLSSFINMGGVDCSGFAYALMKLYKLYGYESYTYHYGDLSNWNDVVTLVEVKHNGKKVMVVEQALFDSVFATQDDEPYDFFQLLETIKMGKEKLIKIKQGNGKPHIAFCSKDDNCQYNLNEPSIRQITRSSISFKSKFSTHILYANLKSFLIPRDVQYKDDEEKTKNKNLLEKIKNTVIY